MNKIVHIFKYNGKEIPVSYNYENIKDRLLECNCVIKLFLKYLEENKIILSEREKKLLIADESIATSYIEGYETWLIPYYVVEDCKSRNLAERATMSCYYSYLYSLEKYKGKEIKTIDSVMDIWKKLVSYKRFFLKRIRKRGVRVGNRLVTSHIAPPAKYVKDLLNSMFKSLEEYNLEEDDKYSLISPILFHYLYTFIHPFLDGNGRSARMIEQIMIKNSNNFDFVIPFSNIILEDRKAYYRTFKSGQTFGKDATDVLSVNLDDFINYNLYTLERGIISIFKILEKKICIENLEIIDFEESLKNVKKDGLGLWNLPRSEVKEKIYNLELYCKYLLQGILVEKNDKIDVLYIKPIDKVESVKILGGVVNEYKHE